MGTQPMSDTFTDYMSPPDEWNDLSLEERINVISTYLVDLEQEVYE